MRNRIIVVSVIALALMVIGANAQEIREVSFLELDHAQEVVTFGDYAYVSDGVRGLKVIDISDIENPRVVGEWDNPREAAYRLAYSDDYVYMTNSTEGLFILDVSDPDNPDDVSRFDTPGLALGVFLSGDLAYIADGERGLNIVDISNPGNPRGIGSCDTPGASRDVWVAGDYAYVADNREGLRVIDVSNPAQPREVGSVDTRSVAFGINVIGDIAFVADHEEGLCAIDISDPENPEIISSCDTPGLAHDVCVSGNHAYISDWHTMRIIDISDPENMEEVGHFNESSETRGLYVSGNYAFVASDGSGLYILDVSDFAFHGPLIELSAEELDFERVGVDLSADLILTITNAGNEDLTISDITVEGDYFSVDFDEDFTLQPEDEADVTVTFTPEERGELEGTLTITSNDEENGEVEVALIGVGVGPVISVNPDELNFGVVGIDLTEELPLTIRNRGLNDLVISSVTNETEFFTFPFDEEITLEPGQQHDLIVTFTPVLGIDYEDTITISCNDPDNETVEVPLFGRGVGALINTDPDIIDFGDVGLARSSDRQLTIRNEGQLDLHVLDIVVEDLYFSVQFDGEFVVEPDRSRNISVTFAPERSGEFEGLLIIASDDRQNDEFIVPLQGTGVGPRIAVDQEIMRFDMRRVGRSTSLLLTITAIGLTDLTVSDVSVEGDHFNHDFDEEVFIELNSRFQVMVTYAPTDDGIHEATLTISSNDEDNPQKTVVLEGSAIDGVISDTPGSALSVYVDGDFVDAYVADDEAGLRIIDVFNPEDPYEMGSYDSDGNCSGVVVMDNYAYVADGSGGMLVVDVSSPQEPELLAVVETPGEALDVDIAGEYAYVADGESGLRVINIYDPERPIEVASHDTPGLARAVMIVGETAYVADDSRGLRIIDITEPEHPSETGSFDTRGWTYDVFVSGNYAFLADERYGLRIIDISDAENPSEIGFYDTDENAYGVTVYGDYAYIADGDGGVCVIHIADPGNPVLVDTYYAPGSMMDVFISGDYAYVAGSASGLLVLDASDYVSVGVNTDSLLPTVFSLSVYPNPFNAKTTIRYGLPYPSNVSIQLCNPLGQRIGTLFEGYRQAGIYTSNMNANDLPSGLYFVRLESSGQILSRKVLLLR